MNEKNSATAIIITSIIGVSVVACFALQSCHERDMKALEKGLILETTTTTRRLDPSRDATNGNHQLN